MSQSNAGNSKGYVATSALAQGRIVKLASGEIVVGAAATDDLIGVTLDAVSAGNVGSVKLRSGAGTVKVIAGGTVAIGDRVTSDAAGAAVATTTAGDEVVGVALEAAVSGDVFEVSMDSSRY